MLSSDGYRSRHLLLDRVTGNIYAFARSDFTTMHASRNGPNDSHDSVDQARRNFRHISFD